MKWVNPRVPRGQQRDNLVTVGEPGGIWALDGDKGEFLWASRDQHHYVRGQGKQYVAVLTGEGLVTLYQQFPKIKVPRPYNGIYVFALEN